MTFYFFSLGGYLAEVHSSSRNKNYFVSAEEKRWNNFLVRVQEPPQEKSRSVKCVVEVLEKNGQQKMGKALVYLQKDSSSLALKYGDLLYLRSRFNPVRSNGNPKEFDYGRYLRIHDIHHQAYLRSSDWRQVGEDANLLMSNIFSLREYFSNVLKHSGMSEKNAMVANALLLGQKEYLDKDVLRSYSSAGAMHVLAVSGLHVGIIMLLLTHLFKPVKRLRFGKSTFLIIVLGGIWFYALITGLSPSVLRASVMFTFVVVGQELQRDTTVYQSILTSAFILIIIEPYIIFQVGFQLSYLAVLGIVYLQPKIENLIYVKNKILFKAWQISAVSIAAQIATFPLGLYYFHQFPNFFMLSNLLVIPLAFFILIVGISYITLHAVPFISDLLFWLLDGLISILNKGVEWVEQLPYSILWGISIEWYEVFLMYLTILLATVAFINRKKSVLWLSLSGVILLLGINLIEKYRLESENRLVIYNISDELAIDVFYGRKNVFYCSQDLMQDEEKLLFHVKHNWFYRTGQEKPNEMVNIHNQKLFRVGDKTFWLLDSLAHDQCENSIPQTNYIVLHDIGFIKSEMVEALKDRNTSWILANDVNYRLRNFLTEKIDSNQFFDLREDGAFEYGF